MSNDAPTGALLHTATMLKGRAFKGTPIWVCDACGVHLVGHSALHEHRLIEEVKALQDALMEATDKLRDLEPFILDQVEATALVAWIESADDSPLLLDQVHDRLAPLVSGPLLDSVRYLNQRLNPTNDGASDVG